MKKIIFGMMALFFVACSPRVKTNLIKTLAPLDDQAEVVVFGVNEEPPASAIEIGTVKIGDTGFSTNCGLDVTINEAKAVARKAGGNVLKITEHISPSLMGSTCDRISAKIMKIENLQEWNKFRLSKKTIVDSTWNYAKIYLYRPEGLGALVNYNVYLGDSVIWRAKSSRKKEIIITKKGMNAIWAKTEVKSEIPINIEYGNEYYIRCTMGMGIMVGHPQLQLVEPTIGKVEFDAIKDK